MGKTEGRRVSSKEGRYERGVGERGQARRQQEWTKREAQGGGVGGNRTERDHHRQPPSPLPFPSSPSTPQARIEGKGGGQWRWERGKRMWDKKRRRWGDDGEWARGEGEWKDLLPSPPLSHTLPPSLPRSLCSPLPTPSLPLPLRLRPFSPLSPFHSHLLPPPFHSFLSPSSLLLTPPLDAIPPLPLNSHARGAHTTYASTDYRTVGTSHSRFCAPAASHTHAHSTNVHPTWRGERREERGERERGVPRHHKSGQRSAVAEFNARTTYLATIAAKVVTTWQPGWGTHTPYGSVSRELVGTRTGGTRVVGDVGVVALWRMALAKRTNGPGVPLQKPQVVQRSPPPKQ